MIAIEGVFIHVRSLLSDASHICGFFSAIVYMDKFCDFRFAFLHTKLLLEKCVVKKEKKKKKKKKKQKKKQQQKTKQQKAMLPVKAVSFKIDNLLEGKGGKKV